MKLLYSFLLAFICKLIEKHDQKKEAWQDKYNNIRNETSSASNSSSTVRRKSISFDNFIGMSDKEIQNICLSLELSPATTRSGNMGSIILYLQENNFNLIDIGIYPQEDDDDIVENESSEAHNQESDSNDPDWLPSNEQTAEEEEIFGYDTEEEDEEEYYNFNQEELLDWECLEEFDHWNYNSANAFQAALITLLHFCIGGQRKQVIEFMTIEVILFSSNFYLKFINSS